jgi:polyisoprenoid-binding protein YceI
MKRTILVTVAALLLLSFTTLQPSTWNLDKAHAKLGFSITHMMISDVEGSFNTFTSTVTSSKEDFSDAVVEMTADVNSVNTGNSSRDNHIKGEDYFDAAKYPVITFKSTSFKKIDDKNYKVTGDLTMHGVTKSIELNALCNTTTHPMTHKPVAGFKITGKIKRTDFGVGSASAMLGSEVTIVANAEFAKQ